MRVTWKPIPRTLVLAVSPLVLLLAVAAPRAADVVPLHPEREGHPSARAGMPAPAAAANPQVAELDQQIKAMRDEFHNQLDPLQAQIKALREKYEPQIQSLVDQRDGLVEQGKSPSLQQLDAQEKSDLAALADREKADLEGVRQKYTDERHALQQKYADQRRELSGHH